MIHKMRLAALLDAVAEPEILSGGAVPAGLLVLVAALVAIAAVLVVRAMRRGRGPRK